MNRGRKVRVNRQYHKMIHSLWQAWKVRPVDGDAIWQMGEAANHELDPSHIRLAVWNICKGLGGVLFEHDYRLLSYLSDIILLQEALLSRRSLEMFCAAGFEAVHGASYTRRDELRDGVMTASRVASHGEKVRIICKYPEPIFNTPKAALVSFYPLAGYKERLMVVNLHATLIRGVRRAVEELLNLMERLPHHEGPMILAGDFNTFTPNYIKAVTATLGHYGLKLAPIDNDPRPVYGVLDQVFVRDVGVKRISVETAIASSDHYPLLCQLHL